MFQGFPCPSKKSETWPFSVKFIQAINPWNYPIWLLKYGSKPWNKFLRENSVLLCVWFGLNVAFNKLSVISRRCLDVAGSSMLTFRVLPHWNITPQTLWHDIPPSHIILTLSWPVLLNLLNTERQAKEQQVPFLKSLVWSGRGSIPKPPGHKADALPLSHCAGNSVVCTWVGTT